jgi:hypothetical protein
VSPIATSCAIKPCALRSRISLRHGPANPKPNRSRLNPIKRPSPISNEKRTPAETASVKSSAITRRVRITKN